MCQDNSSTALARSGQAWACDGHRREWKEREESCALDVRLVPPPSEVWRLLSAYTVLYLLGPVGRYGMGSQLID